MSYKPIPANEQLASKFVDDNPRTKEYYDNLIREEIISQKKLAAKTSTPQKKSLCYMHRCPFMVTRQELKQHLVEHHLLQYKCAICHQLFKSESYCRRHMAFRHQFTNVTEQNQDNKVLCS